MPYRGGLIRRIQEVRYAISRRSNTPYQEVKMDDPNITMEEYIRLEEEKARKRGKEFNWETAKYGPTFAEFSQTLMVGPVAFGGSRVYDHGKGGLTCLIAKATTDESNKWHRRWIENQLNQKVKTIRCDNGTEFKNRDVIEFCGSKGIKREYSNARTPQQNGVAERKNRTLIEAARTMLADSFLPNTFWAEAVSTACYVLNRVLVTKPHNKTPYELLTGKIPLYTKKKKRTTITIIGESEERRTIEEIIRNYYDSEDGETTPRSEA
ncbi:ribonuclease H-like domain-containing protein [Tanacetum coccineum]